MGPKKTAFGLLSLDCKISELLTDSKYEIHEDGTIFSTATGNHLKLGFGRSSRYLRLNYKGKHLLVHRVIYAKFVGDLDSNMVIDHIDKNTFNNSAINLRQITASQNTSREYRTPSASMAESKKRIIDFVEKHSRRPSAYCEDLTERKLGVSCLNYLNPSSPIFDSELSERIRHYPNLMESNTAKEKEDIISFIEKHKRRPRESSKDKMESAIARTMCPFLRRSFRT
jgi:hypothetical protein